MLKNHTIPHIFLRSLYMLVAFLFLFVAGRAVLINVLKNNGITYERGGFDFPSKLHIDGLEYTATATKIHIESMEVSWIWGALFRGQLAGDCLTLTGVNIEQVGEKIPAQETPLFEFPSIKFKSIIVKKAFFSMNSSGDTTQLIVPDLKITDLKLGKTIEIDSLINVRSQLNYVYKPSINDVTDTASGFSLDIIPKFSINILNFEHCNFTFNNLKQQHAISGFNLNLSGLKRDHLVDVSLNQLSFAYQDTLQFDISLEDGKMNDNKELLLKDLDLSLPGLDLSVPSLKLCYDQSLAIEAEIAPSNINASYLWLFISKENLPIYYDADIALHGFVSYNRDSLSFKGFTLGLFGHTSLTSTATFGLTGNRINVDRALFHSTLYEVSKLFDKSLPPSQQDIDLHSDFMLSGSYKDMEIHGEIMLSSIELAFKTKLGLGSNQTKQISLALSSDIVDPKQILVDFPDSTWVNGLSIEGIASIDDSNKPINADISIKSDSMILNGFDVLKPNVKLRSDHGKTTFLAISDTRNLSLGIETTDDIFDFMKMGYSGFMDFDIPQVNNLEKNAGRLRTHFAGSHLISETEIRSDILLDTIQFWPDIYDTLYQTTGSLTFNRDADQQMFFGFDLGEKQIIQLASSNKLFEWLNQENKLYNYPEANLKIEAAMDSTLFESLSGLKGSFQFDELQFTSDGQNINVGLKAPKLTYDDIQIHNFNVDLESSRHDYKGDMRIDSIVSPYFQLDRLLIDVLTNEDSVMTFSFAGELPEIQQDISFGAKLKYLEAGVLVNLDTDKTLQFGNQVWDVMDNRGIFVKTNFEHVFSHLAIKNGNQRISFKSQDELMEFEIDSLRLGPMAELLLDSTDVQGVLNMQAHYKVLEKEYNWDANIADISFDSLSLGTLHIEGIKGEKSMVSNAILTNDVGLSSLALTEENGILSYKLDMENFDLSIIDSYLAKSSEKIHIKGVLNGHAKGKVDNSLDSEGYLAFDKVEVAVSEYGLVTRLNRDTIWLNDNKIIVKDFFLTDRYDQQLAINGTIGLNATPEFNLSVFSENYTVLDQGNTEADISGKVSISTDIKVIGPFHNLNISGNFNTLPNSNISYTYESEAALDEREQVITFTSFNTKEPQIKTVKKKLTSPINWDVDINIAKTDVYILIYEATRDYIKMVAEGSLKLSKGVGEQPILFGEIGSVEGSIFYDAPMVSDLNMKIDRATAKWTGAIDQPAISFKGSEIFRVRPKDIPQLNDDSNENVPVSVYAIVDETSIENFDIHFDLSSSNGSVGSFLNSLPQETRETYAINLLVFGSIEPNGSSSSSMMQGVVSKLNEISRRNIKNADLNFYMDSQEGTEDKPSESVNKFGYSFSKGLLNKKLRLSVGGNVNFSSSSSQVSKKINPFGNIELDYILSERPDISINASRKEVYKGAIDGQINESSLGISYQKRYPNFFNFFRNEKSE